MSVPIFHSTRYMARSSFVKGESSSSLGLATNSEPLQGQASFDFFRGYLREARPFAEGLLTIAQTARSRFHIPPAMLNRIILESDPVITSDATHMRFESFSACCGVYARLDVPKEAMDIEVESKGTTNVDLGSDLRAALSRVRSGTGLELFASPKRFGVDGGDGEVIERKVALPARWVRGFLEVQALLPTLERKHSLRGPAAARFLQGLPRTRSKGGLAMVPTPSGFRVTRPGSPSSFFVGAPDRLALLEGLATSLLSLEVFAEAPKGDQPGFSAWMAELRGGLSLTLLLSAEVWRGLSGEGRALEDLVRSSSAESASLGRVRGALQWQGNLDPEALADDLGLDRSIVDLALAQLGASGLVGYDLLQKRYFHRVLPYDLEQVDKLQPRLADARALVAEGACQKVVDGEATDAEGKGQGTLVFVASRGQRYRVRINAGEGTCTCTWFAKHRNSRGLCKHILAAMLWLDADESGCDHG